MNIFFTEFAAPNGDKVIVISTKDLDGEEYVIAEIDLDAPWCLNDLVDAIRNDPEDKYITYAYKAPVLQLVPNKPKKQSA